jgi:hypothetical protein
MNAKDTADPGSASRPDNLPPTENQIPVVSPDFMDLEEIVTFYCSPVYSAIARLAGLHDPAQLENFTANVFRCVWENAGLLSKEKSPGIFVYKTLLRQVFNYLKEQGNEDRIRILRDILPVDPACYRSILASPRKSFQTVFLSYLRKIIQS